MTDLLVATSNKNKKSEIKKLLGDLNGVNVISFEDINLKPPMIIEDGRTFRENAIKKAVMVSKFFKGLVLADDSGLIVDVLGGKPGVRSARFARKNATDAENNKKLLKLLENVPDNDRTAVFLCHLAMAKGGSLLCDFEGTVKGHIIHKTRGKNGFGYDPLFVAVDHKETFAEIAQSIKNTISHRALALAKFKKAIQKYL